MLCQPKASRDVKPCCIMKFRETLLMEILENSLPHLDDFIRLNEQWITKYFALEAADRRLAENPVLVIEQGGVIFSLVENNQVLGVCALFHKDNGCYEFARMAVAEHARGRGLCDTLIK